MFNTWYHSKNPSAKSKGVSIAFHSSFTPEALDSYIDPMGSFLFLKLNYMQTIFTTVNIHLLNQGKLNFLSSVTARLETFRTLNLFLGADQNVLLNPKLDSSTGKSHISPSTLTKIHSFFINLSLVDTWRVLNPTDRDYALFSAAHGFQSRIDFNLSVTITARL